MPGFTRSISSEKFLEELVVQFSLAQRCKEAETDEYKYFCDFIVGLQYNGSGGKLYHMANSTFYVTKRHSTVNHLKI